MRNRCWRTIVMPVCLIVLLGAIGIAQQQPEKKADEGLPLKTTRTVEFSTDEGSWICVDVSPDGQSIVFDILGDLYLLPITGGDARRITSGPAWDTQARFSPDGRSIAFVSDRSGSDNVWLIDSDGGNPRAVTREKKFLLGSPAWTPDGKYFAVRRGESSLNLNELWLYHKEGGSGIQLTRREGQTRGVAGPAFSGDGRYLYFSGSTQGHVYNSDLGHFQVKRLDRESGNLETLTGLYGGGLRPVLSPDGNFLVYGSRHDGKTGLRARDMRDGTEQWLVYPIDRDEQEGFYCADVMPGYAVTRDNRSVIVSYGGKIHRIDLATKADTIIPFRAEVSPGAGAPCALHAPRGTGTGHGETAAVAERVRGRPPVNLRRPRQGLAHGPARRQAATDNRGEGARVCSQPVARRSVGRLCDLVGRGGWILMEGAGWRRRPRSFDARGGLLSQPGLVAGWLENRFCDGFVACLAIAGFGRIAGHSLDRGFRRAVPPGGGIAASVGGPRLDRAETDLQQ